MEVRERLIDIDEFWQMACTPGNDGRSELIHGKIIEILPGGLAHGHLVGEIASHFIRFDPQHKRGIATVCSGYYSPEDRYTVLSPDAAFKVTEREALPPLDCWVPQMPDIAVEVDSPYESLARLRDKAPLYLRLGAQLVWIVMPETKSVEVWRLGLDGELESEALEEGDALSGEDVLPGFELPLATLFARL